MDLNLVKNNTPANTPANTQDIPIPTIPTNNDMEY